MHGRACAGQARLLRHTIRASAMTQSGAPSLRGRAISCYLVLSRLHLILQRACEVQSAGTHPGLSIDSDAVRPVDKISMHSRAARLLKPLSAHTHITNNEVVAVDLRLNVIKLRVGDLHVKQIALRVGAPSKPEGRSAELTRAAAPPQTLLLRLISCRNLSQAAEVCLCGRYPSFNRWQRSVTSDVEGTKSPVKATDVWLLIQDPIIFRA